MTDELSRDLLMQIIKQDDETIVYLAELSAELLAACEALIGHLLDSELPCDVTGSTCYEHGYAMPCPVNQAKAAIARARA